MQDRENKFTNPLTPFDVAWFKVFAPSLNLNDYARQENDEVIARSFNRPDTQSRILQVQNRNNFLSIRAGLRRRTLFLTFLGLPDLIVEPVGGVPRTLSGAIATLFRVTQKENESNLRYFSRLGGWAALNVLFIIPATAIGNTFALMTKFPLALISAGRGGPEEKVSGQGGASVKPNEVKQVEVDVTIANSTLKSKVSQQVVVLAAQVEAARTEEVSKQAGIRVNSNRFHQGDIHVAINATASQVSSKSKIFAEEELSVYRKMLTEYKGYLDRLKASEHFSAISDNPRYRRYNERVYEFAAELINLKCSRSRLNKLIHLFKIDIVYFEGEYKVKFETLARDPRESVDPNPASTLDLRKKCEKKQRREQRYKESLPIDCPPQPGKKN